MSAPLEPHLSAPDDGIPAADAANGAPPPAEGFRVGGEEPDRPEEATPPEEADSGRAPADTPFRTPDPATGDD